MKALIRKINNLLSRGTVTLTQPAGKLQTLQVALLDDEAKDGVEHFEPFGFTSNPHPGAEVLAAFIEGDRSHGVIIAAADRRYRLQNLQGGEVAIYDDHGASIALTQTGIIIIGGGHPINISGAATINIASGTVNVTGGDVTADGISLKNHKHGGVQAGAAQTGVPV
jgi:phage baseplate assembly protein V